MKTHFLCLSLFLGLSLCSTNTIIAQQNDKEHYYLIEFEQIEQQVVKPLIGALMPLFQEVPYLQTGVYHKFYYQSADLISIEEILKALEGKEVEVVKFEELSKSAYNKILKP